MPGRSFSFPTVADRVVATISPTPPMTLFKSLLACTVLSFAFAGSAFAADEKKPEGTPAGCCAKAAADGKSCTHACCVQAAEAGKQCEKCGGKNQKKS
jgi:hypothetical protein